MAKSLDQANTEKFVENSKGKTVDTKDVELVVRMGIKLLNESGALQQIQQSINQSKDPAQVIGVVLAQMMGQMAEQAASQLNVDPRVFLAKNGFLDHILDYIEKKLGYPEEFSDQVYARVLEVIKAAARSPEAPNQVMGGEQQAAPPEQAPAGVQPAQPGEVMVNG